MGSGVNIIVGLRAVAIMALVGVAACQPTIPDSGAGVGFSDYEAYERARVSREAALRRSQSVFPPGVVAAGPPAIAPVATPAQPVISGDALRAAGLPTASAPVTTAPIGAPISAIPPATTTPPAPTGGGTTAISDEQDFGAVSGRQTIESDAERLARQRAAYEVVQPTAVPTRPGDTGPNIVAYALNTSNALGQRIYGRSSFNADSKFLRACASYTSSDRAQQDFLANGGPQKDPKGVDPDGDGFACYWDPTPFRAAARN